MPRDTSHPRLLAMLLVGVVLAGAAGCTSTPPPARSPFDDRGAAPTAPAGVTSYPPPFPPGGNPAGTPPTMTSAAAREAAAGAATDALAQRMGVPAPRLRVVSIDAIEWNDRCLGVALPGVTCAQVVTPGYRVQLRADTGSTHLVHVGPGGAIGWVPQSTVHATVQQPERANAALALTEAGGKTVSVLLGGGTQRIDVPIGSLKAGNRVVLGVDDLLDGGPLRVVWIAPED